MVAAAGATGGMSAAGLQSAGAMQMGSGLTSLMSGLASLQAASAQAKQFKMQGVFLGLEANAEKLRAREQANFLRERFLRNIASSNASFAARGVSTGSGIGLRTSIEGFKNLAEDIRATELNSQAAQNAIALRQSQTKLAQKTARNLGLLRFSGQASKGTQSLLTGFTAYQEGKKLQKGGAA